MARISKFFSQNKKALILIIGLGLFFSLIPFSTAQAAWWNDIIDKLRNLVDYLLTLPLRIAALFIAIPLAIIALGAGVLYTIVVAILGWVKVIALSVPVIPAKVGVVNVGWTITQNLANMFLILIFVFIGLATILRLREYEAKKLLPTLILVALLINFSPVLVGFVVDISNIISNAFFQLGSWKSEVKIWDMIGDYFKNVINIVFNFDKNVWETLGDIFGTIILGGVLIAFFGYSVWIYALVIGLLIGRIIYLWILMILAPIAFLSKVFPAKGTPALLFPGILHWDEWWKELVKWSIIAIPIGFFLLLSFKVLDSTTSTEVKGFFQANTLEATTSAVVIGGDSKWNFQDFTNQLAKALGLILVPLVSIIILHIGYNLSKKNMPAAAQGIINTVNKGMKFIASSALVTATGGAAAGLAAKGLGGMAEVATRLETGAARMPGGKIWGKMLFRPSRWVTRGLEAGLTPRLLEYQAKTRRVSEADLKKIDSMAPAEAEVYINAKTKILPKWIRERQRLQYEARMAENDTLQYTGLQDDAIENARKVFKDKNLTPFYQKEAMAIAKNLPGVFEGPEGEKAYIAMKTFGKEGDAKIKAINEAKKEIEETRKEIKRRLSEEDQVIEVGLRYKYISEEDVRADKNEAIRKARERIKSAGLDLKTEIDKIISGAAPAATFVKELKPEDIRKIADPDTLAIRVGITLGNPRNLQRIQDNFGIKKLKAVIEGRGGLNDATNSPKKLDEFDKINPQMVNAILSSPAYRELDIEARKHMQDPLDQPTTSFEEFRRRRRIRDITSPRLQEVSRLLKDMAILRRNLARAREDSEIRNIRQQLTDLQDRAEIIKGKLTPEEQKSWDEIENLMGRPPTPRRRRR